jgi:hypothetical protein
MLTTFIAMWVLYGVVVLRVGPRWKFVRYIPFVLGGLIAIAPVWSLFLLMLVKPLGCQIHEGFPNPCMLLGIDIGDPLYTIGLLGSWGFFFIPILAAVGAVYVAIHLPFFFAAKRRDKAAPTSPGAAASA